MDQALALRNAFLVEGAIDLAAPGLFAYELVNGIWAAARRARLSPDVAAQALQNLLDAGVQTQEPDPDRILELALEHGITAYDAAYVAVADDLGCDLWTADRPLYKACGASNPRVRWIGDYQAPVP